MKQKHLLLPMAIAAIMFSFSCSKHEDKIKPEKITDAKASTMGILSEHASISYNPLEMIISIGTSVPYTPYSIKVMKGSNVLYYTMYENSNYVAVHHQLNIGESVSVYLNSVFAGSYTYNGGTPSQDPTWSPSMFTWQIYSDLMKTEVRLTWNFTGLDPVPDNGGRYYMYFQESCPPRNDYHSEVVNFQANTGSYTYTRYRWYTTFDWAQVSFMVKGKNIDPASTLWGDNGSMLYISNVTTSDTYTNGLVYNVYKNAFPYYYY